MSDRQVIGSGLGASAIAAAAGLSPWKSPLQLWLEMTGQASSSASEAAEWGHAVEPALRGWYRERHVLADEDVWHPAESLYMTGADWMRATPDDVIVDRPSKEWRRLVEAKNVGHRMLHRWLDGPPDWVTCQCQWSLAVTALVRSDVIASLGGAAPEVWTVWKDQSMVDDLIAIGAQFMRHVRERTEPRTTHHEDWAAYLARRAKSRGFIVPVDSVDESMLLDWKASTHALRSAKQRSDLAKNRVRRFLADANADGMDTGEGMATWKPDKNGNRSLRAPKSWGGEER